MILGQVNARLEAVIPIVVLDAAGESWALSAVIDTGFSGFLTLPATAIKKLGLPLLKSSVYSLGNNAKADFDIHKASVLWVGRELDVQVLASEAHPLVGMSLLKGFRITIDAVDGGEVRIEPRS